MKSIDEIVDSLFSVLVTAGVVPIIRSPRNNAAEMVAQKLDQKLRDHLKVWAFCLLGHSARAGVGWFGGCHSYFLFCERVELCVSCICIHNLTFDSHEYMHSIRVKCHV